MKLQALLNVLNAGQRTQRKSVQIKMETHGVVMNRTRIPNASVQEISDNFGDAQILSFALDLTSILSLLGRSLKTSLIWETSLLFVRENLELLKKVT